MPFTEQLDPHEVLAHLHQLGYNNISPKQLKEFMYDLKKLIKFDQKIKEANKENADSSSSPCNCAKCTKEKERITFSTLDKTSSSSYSDLSERSSSSVDTTTSRSVKSYHGYGNSDRGKKLGSVPTTRPHSSCK